MTERSGFAIDPAKVLAGIGVIPNLPERQQPHELKAADYESSQLIRESKLPERHLQFARNHVPDQSSLWYKKTRTLLSKCKDGNAIAAVIGPRGTGKTQMATIVCRELILEEHFACLYAKVMEFFMDIKKGYSNDEPELTVLKKYISPKVLVLDEIQERSENDWENRMLTYLVDKRYDAMKSTILLGNIPLEGKDLDPVCAAVGDSIYSRLTETGFVIECRWKSFREKS